MRYQALAFAFALTVSRHVSAQAIDVRLTAFHRVAGALPFSNPTLGVKGTLRPLPGDRLEVAVIALGGESIVAEIRRFVLISTAGVSFAPVAVGGGPDLIFPLDCVPLGLEVGQILPSDVILAQLTSPH